MSVLELVLTVVATVVSIALFVIASATVWWLVHAWREPATLRDTEFSAKGDVPLVPGLSFSLLVPARHEEDVLEDTLEQLARLDHPDYEVVAIVGSDDGGTAAVASRVAARHPGRVRVVVDHSWPKNKPKALNTAIPTCRGEIVGVFDAEDEVHPRLLRVVDGVFRTTGAGVVQGGVQLVNFRSTWFSLWNCLEYFFWFRSRLHLQERHGFIPLGGNTVFVRRELLRAVGGYDPECLAEDCELGVRLSTLGVPIVVAYDPYLVTREETPDTVRSLVKQRTRWNQGFLQVLRKGVWRELPSPRQRMLARYTLAQPFLQAFAAVAIPLAIATALWLHAPLPVAMLTFLPAVPTVAMLVFHVVGLREFCRTYLVRVTATDYLRLLLATIPYQLLLSFAAARAVWRQSRGQLGWEKTSHRGAHRSPAAPATAPEAMRDGSP